MSTALVVLVDLRLLALAVKVFLGTVLHYCGDWRIR